MMLFKLSLKNILDRPLRSLLSVLLLTLGVAMISFVLVMGEQLDNQFKTNIKHADMVVGAKGSPLQLILSSIYHIDAPTGNISVKEALKLAKNPLVKSAIPMAYGDYYKGYRILGTTHFYPAVFEAQLGEGRWYAAPMEVCLGKDVAIRTGLKIGDTFQGMHGSKSDGHVHDEIQYKVVGIAQRTGTVIDQLVLTAIESVWMSHDHSHASYRKPEFVRSDLTVLPNKDQLAEQAKLFMRQYQDKEITAMLVKFRSPMATIKLPRMVNNKTNMQAALPAIEVTRLFDLLGTGIKLFKWIAWIIVITAGLSLFISLFNSLKERKFELALMRAMGGSPLQLFVLILLEGQWIVWSSWVLGIVFSRLGIMFFSFYSEKEYNFIFDVALISAKEWWLLMYCVAVGVVSAFLPSVRIVKLQIAKVLSSDK